MTSQAHDQLDLRLLQRVAEQLDTYLTAFLNERPLPDNLRDAVSYALLGGGKRMRPALVVMACQAVGGELQDALPAAGAMELIHCFSLVHDDLPAMDDDDLRRGRPTLHKHTNEAMAILAGDAMTSLAFELLATRSPEKLAGPLVIELAQATNDMIAGQVYDTLPDFDESISPLERLKTIHRNKTGALIRGSCRMGAIIGKADATQLAALTQYGQAIGLMFQAVDDLLDVTQSTEHLGKAANKDADKGKLTYPGLLGVEETRQQIQNMKQTAMDALADFSAAAQPLRDLCQYMAVRTK